MPALLTRPNTPLKCAIASSAACAICAGVGDVDLAGDDIDAHLRALVGGLLPAHPPARPRARGAAPRRASSTAMARPMPCAAPVTTTASPIRSPDIVALLCAHAARAQPLAPALAADEGMQRVRIGSAPAHRIDRGPAETEHAGHHRRTADLRPLAGSARASACRCRASRWRRGSCPRARRAPAAHWPPRSNRSDGTHRDGWRSARRRRP